MAKTAIFVLLLLPAGAVSAGKKKPLYTFDTTWAPEWPAGANMFSGVSILHPISTPHLGKPSRSALVGHTVIPLAHLPRARITPLV